MCESISVKVLELSNRKVLDCSDAFIPTPNLWVLRDDFFVFESLNAWVVIEGNTNFCVRFE